jgi:hypothetical protein
MIGDQSIKTKGGNPDIKYPPNAGKQAVPFSRPGVGSNGGPLIDSWAEAPNDDKIYVLASVNGSIQWIATTDCES